MDESAILGKMALTIVQIAPGFTSCDFPFAMQFFPNHTLIQYKLDSSVQVGTFGKQKSFFFYLQTIAILFHAVYRR